MPGDKRAVTSRFKLDRIGQTDPWDELFIHERRNSTQQRIIAHDRTAFFQLTILSRIISFFSILPPTFRSAQAETEKSTRSLSDVKRVFASFFLIALLIGFSYEIVSRAFEQT